MKINLKVYDVHRIVHTKNKILRVYSTENDYFLCVLEPKNNLKILEYDLKSSKVEDLWKKSSHINFSRVWQFL